jgi:hypothetical protein
MEPRQILLVAALLAAAHAWSTEVPDTMAALRKPTPVTHGKVVDPRDGTEYPTTTVGAQTWISRNLAWKADSEWTALASSAEWEIRLGLGTLAPISLDIGGHWGRKIQKRIW